MTAVFSLSGVGYEYRDEGATFTALSQVDLVIERGEFVAIVGASGSGKTTMMNLLGLLASPTQGSFLFEGESVDDLDEDARAARRNTSIGFVFQHFALLPRLSVLDNVMLPYRYARRLDGPALQARARALLGALGLGGKENRAPGELSGGQKQRVAIARALLMSPTVLLADEPTGALDSRTTDEVLTLLEALHTGGQTIVVITHDPAVAARAARCVVLKDGRVVSDERRPTPTARSEVSSDRALPAALLAASPPAGEPGAFARVAEDARRRSKAFASAYADLTAHKLRSSLTGLGLMIGVASILVIAGLGVIVGNVFNALFYNAGTSKIYLWYDNERSRAAGLAHWRGLDLRTEFPRFAEQFSRYGKFRPFVWTSSCNVRSESKPGRAALTGMFDPAEFTELDVGVSKGRFPTALEIASGGNVVVLGADTVDAFFARDHAARASPDFPLGQTLAVDGCEVLANLRVVGVLRERDTTFGQRDANDRLYVPASTMLKSMGARTVSFFSILPEKDVDPRWLADHVTNYLTSRVDAKAAFSSGIPAETIEKIRGFMLIIQALTGFIGALCIVVGGIGIFNIMIVTVTERVREIGILKSQGARPRHVRNQFLVESVTLCVLAGTAGIIVGLVVANALALALAVVQPNLGPFKPVFAPEGMVIGLLVSFACGIGFGFIPALRAARLEPAACMREE
jgi:macrolide transport system ATP-binding/permease protein